MFTKPKGIKHLLANLIFYFRFSFTFLFSKVPLSLDNNRMCIDIYLFSVLNAGQNKIKLINIKNFIQ